MHSLRSSSRHSPDRWACREVRPRSEGLDIEFLAPDNATLEAKVKAVVKGAPDTRSKSTTLSLDGKDCTAGRCGFEAKKGQTYRLSAKTSLTSLDELCIVVARP